jgi:general secretion pathway protein M
MSQTASPGNLKTQALEPLRLLWTSHGQARWQSLNARERLLVRVFLGLFGVWLFVSIAIAPALRTLNSAEQQRADIAQQAVQMRSLQQRAQELQKTKPLSREESLKYLQSFTPTGNPALQMTIQGDRVLVNLKNLSASQLAGWLAQARSIAQALPDEVHITRSTSSGLNNASSSVNPSNTATTANAVWDGQMVLRLPQGPSNYLSRGVKP